MTDSNIKNYNSWLDLFRGLAALLVCIGHIRNAFWVDYAEIQIKAWWHMPAYLLTGLGHQAVVVFFVLSGFLVGGGAFAKGKNFLWIDYFSARLVRLWLVLIPALLFTAACDFLTLRTLPSAFDGMLSSLWNSAPSTTDGFGWRVFVANGLFLQTIVAPVFGSNGPLWSLANEFWYYILFPLIGGSLNLIGNVGLFKRGIMLLLVMVIASWLPYLITLYFSVWLMGVACFILIRKYPTKVNKLFLVLSIILFLGSLATTKILPKVGPLVILADILVGVLFSTLVICLNGQNLPWKNHGLLGVTIKKLSDLSYSLYLFHFPLVIFLAVTLVGSVQFQPNLISVVALLSTTALCLAVAWASWFIFERHNVYIRGVVSYLMWRQAFIPRDSDKWAGK